MSSSVSILRRLLAWLADYLAVMIPGMAIVLVAMAQLVHGLPGFVGGVAAERGWGYLAGMVFHTGSGGASSTSGEWVSFALPLIVALLLVPLLQFLYQATMLSWRGRTFGKMLLDTRIAPSTADAVRPSRGAALRRAFLTTTLETGVVAIALVLITIGQVFLGALLWAAAIIAFWVNAFSVFAPRHRSIVDRLSGTIVLPRGLYAELATAARAALPTRSVSPALPPAAPHPAVGAPHPAVGTPQPIVGAPQPIVGEPHPAVGTPQPIVGAPHPAAGTPHPAVEVSTGAPALDGSGPSASDAARTAGRKASEAALAAGRATADAAAVAGQLAKEGAQTVMRSETMQQALNSRAGQQAQALGAAGAEKAKELGAAGAERAKELGAAGAERAKELGAAGAEQARKLRGKAQEMWRQRRANRTGDESEPT